MFLHQLFLCGSLFLLIEHMAVANPISLTCIEPDDLETRFYGNMHESSYMLLTPSRHRHSADINFYKHVRRTYILGNTSCTITDDRPQVSSQMVYPSCPWHYVLNVDPNRRPTELVEAKCNCRNRCLGAHGNSKCQPVKYFVKVLRKYGCDYDTMTFLYREAIEAINAGCTCMLL